MSARKVAAQRAIRPNPPITIPKGGKHPLPKTSGGFKHVENHTEGPQGGKR